MILNSSTFVIVAGFILKHSYYGGVDGRNIRYLGNMINLVLPTIISPLWLSASWLLC